jgi:hypothetical protein
VVRLNLLGLGGGWVMVRQSGVSSLGGPTLSPACPIAGHVDAGNIEVESGIVVKQRTRVRSYTDLEDDSEVL